jgi:hypothetical protein
MRDDLPKLVRQFTQFEFNNNEDVKRYAKLVRTIGAELYLHTHFHASEVEAKLSRYRGRWYQFGMGAKVRARLVAARLRIGAEACKAWGVSGIKMHAAFEKHFVAPERTAKQAASRKRTGAFSVNV